MQESDMNSLQKNYLTCCLVVVVAALMCNGHESSGSGDGEVDCTASVMEYLGCAEGDRVERFYFSPEENRCKSYNTCLPEDPQAESNFFASLEVCETSCPPKKFCDDPPYPPNGMHLRHKYVENGELKQTLVYSCFHGYHLVGPQVIECTDGAWSEEQPVCQQTTCPDVAQPAGERILNVLKLCQGPQTPDCHILYSCEKNYQLVYGSPIRRCQEDGTWSGEQPYCGKLVIKHDGQEVEAISIPDGNENLEIDCIMIPHFPPSLLSSVHWLPRNRNTSWTMDNSSFQLKFERVHLTDAGDYKCEVSGDSNRIERKIKIKVKEKELVTDGWKPNLVLAIAWPQFNKLLCAIDGKPKADVRWYVNGNLLDSSNSHYTINDESRFHPTFNMATLLINDPTEDDYDATYQCIGENNLGQTSPSNLTFQQSTSKRSAPASKEDTTVPHKAMCSPDSVIFLGRVRRVLEQARGEPSLYHIRVDTPLVSSRPITQTVIKANSDSAMAAVQRHQPYVFVTQRTSDDNYVLNTVLPYTDDLESVILQLCS